MSTKEGNSFVDNKGIPVILTAPFRIYLAYTTVCALSITGGGMFWYASFQGTSVGTNLSLSRLRAVFVYILSVLILGEKVSLWKSCSVLLSFIGVVCFAWEIEKQSEDGDKNEDRWYAYHFFLRLWDAFGSFFCKGGEPVSLCWQVFFLQFPTWHFD